MLRLPGLQIRSTEDTQSDIVAEIAVQVELAVPCVKLLNTSVSQTYDTVSPGMLGVDSKLAIPFVIEGGSPHAIKKKKN